MYEIYIVWEMAPEETHVYYLVKLSSEDFERIKRCHGYFVNQVNIPEEINNDLLWLSEYLDDKQSSLLYSNETCPESPIEVKDGTLAICGWML